MIDMCLCLWRGTVFLGLGTGVTAGGQKALSGGSLGEFPKKEV